MIVLRRSPGEYGSQSRFGWHVRGDTPSSNRIYDILALGAVPLVVSPDTTKLGSCEMCQSLPFLHELPWHEIVVLVNDSQLLSTPEAIETMLLDAEAGPRMTAHQQAQVRAVLWHVDPTEVTRRILLQTHRKIWNDDGWSHSHAYSLAWPPHKNESH